MAFSLSPSIQTVETNSSFTTNNLPSSTTAAIIRSDWGYALESLNIQDASKGLPTGLGTPTQYNYLDWYEAWNFLQYGASSFYAVRPIDALAATKNTGIALSGGLGAAALSATSTSSSVGSAPSYVVTLNFTAMSTPFIVGSPVTLAGFTCSGTTINGIQTVATSSLTSITFTPTGGNPGNITVQGTISIAPAALTVYQGINQANLYNNPVALSTLTNLTVAGWQKIVATFTETTSNYTFTLLTVFGDNQATQKTLNSGIIDINGVDSLQVSGTGGTYKLALLNSTYLNGWDIDGKLATGTQSPAFQLGEVVTGSTSGAKGTVSVTGANLITLTGVTKAFTNSESLTGSLGGAASATAYLDLTGTSFLLSGTGGSGSPYSFTGNLPSPRVAFFHQYVTYSGQNIAVGVCSDAGSFAGNVSTDIPVPWTSLFSFAPNFAIGEFAVVVYQNNGGVWSIPNNGTEKFIVNYIPGSVNYANQISFAESVLNNGASQYIYCKVNTSSTALVNTGGGTIPKFKHTSYDTIYPRSGNTFPNVTWNGNGYVQADINAAYAIIQDPEAQELDILISHSLSPNQAATITATRQDCLALVGPWDYTQLVGVPQTTALTYMVNNFGTTSTYATPIFNAFGTYAAIYGNMKYQYDNYNQVNRWMSCLGDVAGLMAATDANLDPWWAVAGVNRGVIRNAIKVAWISNKTSRDTLYSNSINPIYAISGQGAAVIYGQKTATPVASAFDRINVRRLLLIVEKTVRKSIQPEDFEFNDPTTRNQVKGILNPYLSGVQARRGLYSFLVVCDQTNNPESVIDQEAMVIDVYLQPTKVAEFIKININVTQTGVTFSEIVGASPA